MVDITTTTGYAAHMIRIATVDDLDGNLHRVPLYEVANWYDQLGENEMQDEYEALKTEVLGMGLKTDDDGEQKRLLKVVVVTVIDIAKSLNRIANKP